jgi:ferredoxin
MNVENAKLVYYSPTGTTKAVVQGIAQGFNPRNVERVDVTKPDARKRSLSTSDKELLIIGVPVYMGRVPDLLSEWLNAIHAHETPTVCVVVYGNRAYENALLELKDIVTSRGCIPVAGAAYIGEHSFSSSEVPVALGRPDEADIRHAEELGRKIRDKLQSASSISQASDLQVPGTRPYGGITEIWDVDFIAVSDRCIQCGLCAEACPVGAVDSQDSAMIDQQKCITCCACIKSCPEDARTIKTGPVQDAQQRLMSLHKEPKRPDTFL